MNINYIRGVLEKYKEKDFSNLLEFREYKIKLFSLPLSIILTILISYTVNLIFGIEDIVKNEGFLNVFFISFCTFTLFILYQSYFIIQGLRAYLFDKRLEENYQDLLEIYSEVLFIKYQEKIQNDNPFPYFLTELNDIKDKEIKEYIEIINKVNQIKNN